MKSLELHACICELCLWCKKGMAKEEDASSAWAILLCSPQPLGKAKTANLTLLIQRSNQKVSGGCKTVSLQGSGSQQTEIQNRL